MSAALEPRLITPQALRLRAASLGFHYPDAAWRERFPALLGHARRTGAFDAARQEALEAAFLSQEPAALEAEHFRLFGPAAACTLDLAQHMSPNPFEQAKRLADIGGFLKAFGVEAEGRADALPVALEFAAYLEIKRAHALAEGRSEAERTTAQAARKFAAELLAPGLARFAAKLGGAGAPALYLRLAEAALAAAGGLP